jgi:DNA processing protein
MAPADFYNSLNVFFGGNYSKLSSAWKKHGNWETAHKNEVGAPDPEKERGRLEAAGIKLVLIDAPEFPEFLKEIPYPPFGLYIKGSLGANIPTVAVVGTRKATEEGLSLAYDFGQKLSGRGVCVASGLAFGVDKSAHEGALSSCGKTVAVLPGGLNEVYPSSHAALAAKILYKGGALVSEYPLGHKPAAYNFLERNRIISGLSRGVVIIEAPEISGALATARFALEQNREVYVVPGPAKHRNYAGSHGLIKSGAALVTSPEDVLLSLGISAPEEEKLASLEEKAILKVLRAAKRPLNMEEIVEMSGIAAPIASQAVSLLVLQSRISEHGTSYEV